MQSFQVAFLHRPVIPRDDQVQIGLYFQLTVLQYRLYFANGQFWKV